MSACISSERDIIKSLSYQKRNKSATKGAQLVAIGIPTTCLYKKNFSETMRSTTKVRGIGSLNLLFLYFILHLKMVKLAQLRFTYKAMVTLICVCSVSHLQQCQLINTDLLGSVLNIDSLCHIKNCRG